MLLTKVTLNDFKVYRGRNEFDFKTTQKPIILCGGTNGAGKTLQMIYFGRAHCPALRHDLETCPVCSWAASKRCKAEEERKNRSKRTRSGSTR